MTIQGLETGQPGCIDTIARLAQALNLEPSELMRQPLGG
jgi:hypothetical protein